MDTWQNIVESQKRNEIQRSVINATRQGILPKIARQNRI